MEFLLIDVGATAAALLGYVGYLALERHRSQGVTLRRPSAPVGHSLP
ncbi:MAG TPA: hypothetical protein VK695_12330 [Steroidobacteraceae bacterium]|jgi:hypothetical protein|nr:hypothetical protein [Steroidobacteraceae bacterium]